MATFAYSARDHTGSAISGTLVAESVERAGQMIRAEGKYPTSISPAGVSTEAGPFRPGGSPMSRKDLIHVATQLAIMIDTGVTLSDALDCIAAQAEKPNVKRIIQDICQEVQAGVDFSTALQRHPRAFPRLFVSLISASEKSGMMAKLLQRATSYLRDEHDTIRRVRGALTYPAIMFGFAIGTTTFLLAFVLPKFTAIYASKKAALPVPTKILMVISSFICAQWLLILMVLGTTIFAFVLILRTRPGARAFHYIQLNVPLFGALFRKVYLSRGLRLVGTMAGAGVSLVDCVKTAHDLTANSYFKDLWDEVSQEIQAGKQFSEPLFRNSLVPRSVSQMLHSAERSGKLAQVMEQVSTFAEEELKQTIADLTRYIEPLMIAIMGAIIGSVVIALMLPIFTISKVIVR
ncbi:MAG TPA: type II secretion system F family protein [Tepidisphaeraceae bacterium]|jgi:type IV pilus assembly protein PilC|nr:type II secretion system F family protein [Tepidisphaeraceae bacterium]